MIRDNGPGATSFMPDGGAVFSVGDVHENLFFFDDLFELPAHQTSSSGLDGRRERWSDGWRALDPSVSPDGRRVVFTTNHRGTTYLMMADVVASPSRPGYARAREPAPARRRSSPSIRPSRRDGRPTTGTSPTARGSTAAIATCASSTRRTCSVFDVTHDRAIDGDPATRPTDAGSTFTRTARASRTCTPTSVATGALKQVTNVINGAYQPEPSPDGKSLAYVGYTHDGYDVFVMPLDESQWLDPLPYDESRPAPPAEPPAPLPAS